MKNKALHVSDTPYSIFVVGLSLALILLGLIDGNALLYFGIALAPFSLLFLGTTTIHPNFVSRKTPWGSRRIAWSEVIAIEALPYCYWIVLNGRGKRLSFIGPANLYTDTSDPPVLYLEELAEQHDVPMEVNLFALFKWSRGT